MALAQDGRKRGYFKILSICLLLSCVYPSSWTQTVGNSAGSCPGATDPSCIAEVLVEVGGCRSVFTTNVCNCQDDDPPVPCSLNPCTDLPAEPTVTSTLYTTTPTTTEAPTTTPSTVKQSTTTHPTTSTTPTTTTTTAPGDPGKDVRNCHEIYMKGITTTTTYHIYPSGDGGGLEVYCIMDTDKGNGWTVIQRRVANDTTDFDLNMDHYVDGFGNVADSHWLGLDNIYNVVGDSTFKLKVEMTDFADISAVATYGTFEMTGPFSDFKLKLLNYDDVDGTAGNAMAAQNGMKFSTKDNPMHKNPDLNCAIVFQGGFWYNRCPIGDLASPNGPMTTCATCGSPSGIYWSTFRAGLTSLKSIVMMTMP